MPELIVARGNWLGFVDSDDYDRPYLTVKKCCGQQSRLGAELAVCNEVLCMKENKALDSYQEHCLKVQKFSQEKKSLHRIQPVHRCYHGNDTTVPPRDVFEKIRFPEGKNYEDAFTVPEILERVNKAACVAEPLYQYRLRSGSIMHAAGHLEKSGRSPCKLCACLAVCTQVPKI